MIYFKKKANLPAAGEQGGRKDRLDKLTNMWRLVLDGYVPRGQMGKGRICSIQRQ